MLEHVALDVLNDRYCDILGVFFINQHFRAGVNLLTVREVLFIFVQHDAVLEVWLFRLLRIVGILLLLHILFILFLLVL